MQLREIWQNLGLFFWMNPLRYLMVLKSQLFEFDLLIRIAHKLVNL